MFTRLQRQHESGFTLVELLVVMVIISVLAAIAIPIFLNQQKTAKDTAVTTDVKNVAAQIQSLLVGHQDATEFSLSQRGASGLPSSQVLVGVEENTSKISLSDGVIIALEPGTQKGTFRVYGWNPDAKSYASRALVYDSEKGGLQRTSANLPSSSANTQTGGSTNSMADSRWTHAGDVTVSADNSLKYTIKWNAVPDAISYRVRFTESAADGSEMYTQYGDLTTNQCSASQCSYTFEYGNGSPDARQVLFTVTPKLSDGTLGTDITGEITFK